MVKKSLNNADKTRARALATEEERSPAQAAELHRQRDTIRPALELSDLARVHDLGSSLSKQGGLTKIVDKNALSETLAAHQRMVDWVRASMHLPALERVAEQVQIANRAYENLARQLANSSRLSASMAANQRMLDQVRVGLNPLAVEQFNKRIGEASSAVSTHLAKLQGASELARAAAEAIPAPKDSRPTLPLPPVERADGETATTAVASAHDLGRLVREARESRKLSQQAFADLVGVGRRFISELENGKPTLELGKVLQVAAASGIDLLARRRR